MTGNGSKALRRYDLRDQITKRWLGTVVVSEDGFLFCHTDYGDYNYYWGDAGSDFVGFLLKIDADYLLRKVSRRDEYDGDKTLRNIRQRICELRRSGSLTKAEAREEWNRLSEFDLDDMVGFTLWYQDTKLQDAYELIRHDWPAWAKCFAERVWPVLCAAIRAEREAAK